MFDPIGMSGVFNLTVTLISIALSWWCLQIVNFDVLLKNPKSKQARTLQIVLSIIIGYQLAKFIIDYSNWSSMLRWLF